MSRHSSRRFDRLMTKLAFWIAPVGMLAGCAAGAPPPADIQQAIHENGESAIRVVLGPEENVIKLGTWGTRWIPDGHMTYLTLADGASRYWWAGGTVVGPGETLAFSTNDALHFTPRLLKDGDAVASLLPDHPGSAAPDADYAGPGSVLPASNGHDLLMIYHGENHTFGGVDNPPGNPYYATICLARSSDGGLTWKREGAIIRGMQPKPANNPPRSAMGAGIPDALIVGGYIYVFYVDWAFDLEPDLTHVARSPVARDGAPGSWKKWHDGSFSTAGLGGLSTPVMGRPEPVGKTVWAANVSVSYNAGLHRYVNVFQTAIGFYYATSTDLTSWHIGGQVFPFGDDNDQLKTGQTWYSYPSYLSPGEPDDRLTQSSGYLYYAKAAWGVAPHTMYRRRLRFASP
jgi:hypothetical protein